jgi:uncharacterized protein (DUF4415 family)
LQAKHDRGETLPRAEAPDIELDEHFWRNARIVMPDDKGKTPVSLRVDAEAVEWFTQQGKGYLTRMNAVLRADVETQKQHHPCAMWPVTPAAHDKASAVTPWFVAQRVSGVSCIYACAIKPLPVVRVCRIVAGMQQPLPIDDCGETLSQEMTAQGEQGKRTRGC